MHAEWTVVVDDGTRPYGPGIQVDQRRPLRLIVGDAADVEIRLINPVGGAVLLSPGDFLQLNIRTLCQPTHPILTVRSEEISDQKYRIAIPSDTTRTTSPQRAAYDLWLVRGVERMSLIPLSECLLSAGALGNNYR